MVGVFAGSKSSISHTSRRSEAATLSGTVAHLGGGDLFVALTTARPGEARLMSARPVRRRRRGRGPGWGADSSGGTCAKGRDARDCGSPLWRRMRVSDNVFHGLRAWRAGVVGCWRCLAVLR
jgi:hypothetical protein